MKNKIKNTKGFTLIELIVVMAVIGILVLIAAPRFLGYTKDANVTAMEADAKVLSNIALVYNVENEEWPVTGTAAKQTFGTIEVEALPFSNDLIKNEYKSLKNDIDQYMLVVEKDSLHEGKVFHKDGVEDRKGVTHYGGRILQRFRRYR